MAAVVEMVKRYAKIKEEMARLETEKNKLKDELVKLLGDSFEGVIEGEVKIKISKMRRYVIDSKKVKAELGEKAKEFEKEIESLRIDIKRV